MHLPELIQDLGFILITAAVISANPKTTNINVDIGKTWTSTSTPAPEGFFKLHIKPASDHAIDIPDSFSLEVTNPTPSAVALWPGSAEDRTDTNLWPFASSSTEGIAPVYTFTGNTPREFLLKLKRTSTTTPPTSHGEYIINIRYFKNGVEIGNDPSPQTINIKPTFK